MIIVMLQGADVYAGCSVVFAIDFSESIITKALQGDAEAIMTRFLDT